MGYFYIILLLVDILLCDGQIKLDQALFQVSLYVMFYLKSQRLSKVKVKIVRKHHFPNFRPGAYEHRIPKDRKIQFDGSFGGPQTLKTSVTLICHNGEPEKVRFLVTFYQLYR